MMKFRAKLVDIGCIQHFSRVIGTIARLAKLCILRITVERMYFILSERIVSGGIAIWCELHASNFFNEFNMEGVNADANEIYLELVPDSLVRCLKAAQNAKSIKIKLTKKNHPCLTLEVELPSMSETSRIVTHDIPVDVIPRRLWINYSEPESPEFDVSVFMPALRVVRNVVERMKNLSNFVTISALPGKNSRLTGGVGSTDGAQMKLCVETDLVTVTTHFRELVSPVWDQSSQHSQLASRNENEQDLARFFEARIDIRKLAQFLSGQQVNPTKVICNIADDRMVHLFMFHDDVSLQFFMPSVNK